MVFRVFVLIIGFSFFSGLVFAQNSQDLSRPEIIRKFSGFDPISGTKINHGPLSDYLSETVFPGGRSKNILGNEKPKNYLGSKIKIYQALGPSRFENSRLFLFAFSQGHKDFFRAYLTGLEALSVRRSISSLNRDEQLAFWLNLYNVILINTLIQEYPTHNLEGLLAFTDESRGFRNQKVTEIEGVSLSLNDIEAILFNNYESPLVAFGLWQGAIGGPRLLNYAFTGEKVWEDLEKNAMEFVNSNRGLRPPKGNEMKVSEYYWWVLPAFENSETNVLNFIKRYVDPNFVSDVERVTSIEFGIYNWVIADLVYGIKHGGQTNQPGGTQQNHGGGKFINGGHFDYYRGYRPSSLDFPSLPPVAMEFFIGHYENNDLFVPNIKSEECSPTEECIPNKKK